MLSDRQIAAGVDDRLARWGKFLRDNGALPTLIVGMKVDGNVPVVTTVEHLEDDLVAGLLEAVAAAIRAGRAEHR